MGVAHSAWSIAGSIVYAERATFAYFMRDGTSQLYTLFLSTEQHYGFLLLETTICRRFTDIERLLNALNNGNLVIFIFALFTLNSWYTHNQWTGVFTAVPNLYGHDVLI